MSRLAELKAGIYFNISHVLNILIHPCPHYSEFRVALEHQRLLDKEIFDAAAHEYHVFDFKAKVLAVFDCLMNSAEHVTLFHPAVKWMCPVICMRGTEDVQKYCQEVSILRNITLVNVFVDPDLILVDDDKVIFMLSIIFSLMAALILKAVATINMNLSDIQNFQCLLILKKEVSSIDGHERHHLEDRIVCVESSFNVKDVLLFMPRRPMETIVTNGKIDATPTKSRGRPKKISNMAPDLVAAIGYSSKVTNLGIPFLSSLFYAKTSSASMTPSPLSALSDASTSKQHVIDVCDDNQICCSPCMDDFNGGGFLFDGNDFVALSSSSISPDTSFENAPLDFTWIAEMEIGRTEEI